MVNNNNKYLLLSIIQSYAPSGAAQQLMSDIHNKMIQKGNDDKTIILYLANTLSDGLTHGNWPWVILTRVP